MNDVILVSMKTRREFHQLVQRVAKEYGQSYSKFVRETLEARLRLMGKMDEEIEVHPPKPRGVKKEKVMELA